jgi:undecaprenyl pyrophosphate synthase
MTPPLAAALETAIATFAPRAAAAPRSAPARAPQHIASVLDANGARALFALVDGALQHSVTHLSLDVSACAAEAAAFVSESAAALVERGVAFRALTNLAPSPEVSALLCAIRALPATATPRLTVTLAVAYDTKQDLVNAAQSLEKNGSKAAAVSGAELQKHMAASELPAIDLFLYTNGSARLSSFLLWHAAYAELCFSPTPWNVFGAGDVRAMVNDYAARSRTFGALKK